MINKKIKVNGFTCYNSKDKNLRHILMKICFSNNEILRMRFTIQLNTNELFNRTIKYTLNADDEILDGLLRGKKIKDIIIKKIIMSKVVNSKRTDYQQAKKDNKNG